MFRAIGLLENCQRSLAEGFRGVVVASSLVEIAQVVETRRYKGIVRAEGLLINCQRSLVEGLSQVVVVLVLVDMTQDREGQCHRVMVGADSLLGHLKGFLSNQKGAVIFS